MIDHRVVLVLGAGASQPYGFPLGRGLINRVVSVAGEKRKNLIDWGFDGRVIDNFTQALRRARVRSIDEFLESRKGYVPLNFGKALIAYELISCEKEDNLYPAQDDWVRELFGFMCTETLEEFRNNKLTVVTYNYDRSFDLMLFHYLKEKHSAQDEQVQEVLSKIQIIHLHGQIGLLPHQYTRNSEPHRGYTPNLTHQDIIMAINGIQIIHEDVDVANEPEYKRAHDAIRLAEYVIFLGFGYHQTNVQRLRLPECCARSFGTSRVHLAGTGYNLTDSEMKRVERQFRNPGGAPRPTIGLNLERCTCTEFLRNNHDLFMKLPSYPDYPILNVEE